MPSRKNWLQAAGIAWPRLTAAAKARRTLTYEELAPYIATNPLSVGYALSPIQSYCMGQLPVLPPLTALVVGKNNKLPGAGFVAWPLDDLEGGLRLVFDTDWDSIPNPFLKFTSNEDEDAFVETLLKSPDQAFNVYVRVASRGIAQDIFRRAVRKAYGNQCAMCGLTIQAALEAAHIVPWHIAAPEQRIDPRNGILLCAIHHRLFDRGDVTVSESFRVVFPGPKKRIDVVTVVDRHATTRLSGKAAFLPNRTTLYPSVEALKHHHRTHKWGAVP